MRSVIIGLGVQGVKRLRIAGKDCIATVDPVNPDATFRHIEEVPLNQFDAAMVCTPDQAKLGILSYLLDNRKHVLVEKPLFADDPSDLIRLRNLAASRQVTCYTAYNHRFEPHFMRLKQVLDTKEMGEIYTIRLFYGNGTARLVRNSAWKDQGAGVIPDLGSHLLDTLHYWLDGPVTDCQLIQSSCFENRAPDHCLIHIPGRISIQLEMTLLSWRNHFSADIMAEKGSLHIDSLCKWGPSRFTARYRQLPSGVPREESHTLVQPDPTWQLEYDYFLELCKQRGTNLNTDIWINQQLQNLAKQVSNLVQSTSETDQ